MNIVDILKKRMSFSFEVFPPKDGQSIEPLLAALPKFSSFKPDFISCTHGAGGSGGGRGLDICAAVKQTGCEAVAHFTCIGNTRADVRGFIAERLERGVEHFLLLRGDFPPDWTGTRGDFAHAGELTAFVNTAFPGVQTGVAGYPEKHIESPSFDADLAHLRAKQDNGACFIISQLCHDIDAYRRYVERVRRAGIRLPIIFGLMPVLDRDFIIRASLRNGCSIPAELAVILGKYAGDAGSFLKAGIEYTVQQMHRAAAAGVDGLHIYTMNKWRSIDEIVRSSGLRMMD